MWGNKKGRNKRKVSIREKMTNEKCTFPLTEVNISKGTTPYLSPQPVFVPHSQLHGCKVSLSSTDNMDTSKQTKIKLQLLQLFSLVFLSVIIQYEKLKRSISV